MVKDPISRILGLTAIESLVAVTIYTLATLSIMSSILYFYRANAYAIEQAFAVDSARRGIERIVRFAREATYSEEGAFPILSIGTSTLNFYSDLDADDSIERVRVYIVGTNLMEGVTKPSGSPPSYDDADEIFSVVSDNVRNIEETTDLFEFFDAAGTPITNFANVLDVAYVRINLIVNINPTRLPNEFVLRSSATFRNLKTNL